MFDLQAHLKEDINNEKEIKDLRTKLLEMEEKHMK